jgi:hypothetical protein
MFHKFRLFNSNSERFKYSPNDEVIGENSVTSLAALNGTVVRKRERWKVEWNVINDEKQDRFESLEKW